MKECGETDGVPQVTMHLQTFSYIFQNNILCKSETYIKPDVQNMTHYDILV